LGEEYRSLSSSLCSFLHSPVVIQPITKMSPSYRRRKHAKDFFLCNLGMARPQVADRRTASDMEGSCE
jgi:hypothetical protein